jgi:hypothetical protein
MTPISRRRSQSRAVLQLALLTATTVNLALAQDIEGQLAEARLRWESAAFGNYRFAYKKHCPCYREEPATTIVTVRDGRVAEVRYRHANASADVVIAADRIQWYWTVEDLFGVIADALASDMLALRAEYEPTHGYPEHVYLDYDPAAVGDEIELRAVELTPLPAQD